MTDYSWIRGFNYQPGYAYNSYESWRFFDAATFRRELACGKKNFPKFNVVRYWLSYEAFRYEEDRQEQNFETALQIADELGLKVVPILFNRWHDHAMDNGGIYIDQMVADSNWCSAGGTKFDTYIDKIVGAHGSDPRILAWDICNEPYSYGKPSEFTRLIAGYEKKWLEQIYAMCKAAGARQPVSFSPYSMDPEFMRQHAHICDVFMQHWYVTKLADMETEKQKYTERLSALIDTAKELDRGFFTTETCWGSTDNEERARFIEVVLEPHNRLNVGFIVHALAYSHCPDLHDACDGIVGSPGNLAFMTPDGAIRPKHEIFNNY